MSAALPVDDVDVPGGTVMVIVTPVIPAEPAVTTGTPLTGGDVETRPTPWASWAAMSRLTSRSP